ncbi:MAG: hypothetical protein EOM29_08550 [Bacteroidia bacterium]|nr:hypothetical protein [Bacteroidia bacterium]
MTNFEKAREEYSKDFEIRYPKIKEEQEAEKIRLEEKLRHEAESLRLQKLDERVRVEEKLRQETENLKREQLQDEAREKRIAAYKAEELKLEEAERKRITDNKRNRPGLDGSKEDDSIINPKKYIYNKETDSITYGWWKTWAWLSLIFGNLYIFSQLKDTYNIELMSGLIIFNITLNILILRYNKYAFLIATILSINPILWIINGIYLKNRWNHPLVNNGIDLRREHSKSIKKH